MSSARTLDLQVISPTQVILSAEGITAFTCRMQGLGSLEILPGHHPLIGVMEACQISYRQQAEPVKMTLPGGILRVAGSQVRVYVLDDSLQPGSGVQAGARFISDVRQEAQEARHG